MSDLQCRGVSVAFGSRAVLRGVDLDVPPGASCAVVGPSGSGKSTLLRVVAGLQRPDHGAVAVGGRRVTDDPTSSRSVALVFQEPRLFPAMTVGENVAYALRARGVPRPARRRAAQALLCEVGLEDRADERPSTLSGGEQQRVALARALAAEPRVLLLDEPISAVDGPGRAELRDLLRRVRGLHPVTTVIVTHDLEDATALADRIAVLADGVILQCDEPSAVLERPACPAVALIAGNPNVLHGTVHAGVAEIGAARLPVTGPDGPASFTVRPEHVSLSVEGVEGWSARVTDLERRGTRRRIVVAGAFGRLEVLTDTSCAPGAGDMVTVTIPPDRLWRFPDVGVAVPS